jgi:hypothetical protein
MPFEPLPLNVDTLERLLNEGGERAELDFKRMCNLSERRDVVELSKDIGAMQIKGGYIVIGADDNGEPTGEVARSTSSISTKRACAARSHATSRMDLRCAPLPSSTMGRPSG